MTVTDEQTQSAFHSAYATVVATTPIPLDWDDITRPPLPLEQPSRSPWQRKPLVAFSAAAVLVLVAIAAVVLGSTTSTVRVAGEPGEWIAVLFLADDTTQSQVDAISERLQDLEGVTGWVYVDKQMALDEALAIFRDDHRQTAIILEDPSIIPSSLRFSTVDETTARAVVRLAAEEESLNPTGRVVTEGIVVRGPLVRTGPIDSTEPTPSQGDFVVTTTLSPQPDPPD